MGDVSPVNIALEKSKTEKLTGKEFRDVVKYLEMSFKDLMNLQRKVTDAGSQGLMIDEQLVNRATVNSAIQTYTRQLSDLNKLYRARGKKRSGGSEHLLKLFYIPDQLVDLYSTFDWGLGKQFEKDFRLITEHHMATSGMLTSLISRYCKSLRRQKGGFYEISDEMNECLSTTHYLLNGENLKGRYEELDEDLDLKTSRKIENQIKNGKKAALDILKGQKNRRGDLLVTEDGFLHEAVMKINALYRIPDELLTEDEREALVNPKYVKMGAAIRSRLADAMKQQKKEEEDRKQKERAQKRKEKEAAKAKAAKAKAKEAKGKK